MVYSLRSRSKSPTSSSKSLSSIPTFSDEDDNTTTRTTPTTDDLFDDNNNYRAESPTYENGYMFRRKKSVTAGSNNISLTIGGINGKIQIPNGVIKPIPRKPDNNNNSELRRSNVVGSPQHPRHQLTSATICKPAKRGRHRIHSVDDILDNLPKKRKTRASNVNNDKENVNNKSHYINLNDINNNNNNNNNSNGNSNKNYISKVNKFQRYNQNKSPNRKDGEGKIQTHFLKNSYFNNYNE